MSSNMQDCNIINLPSDVLNLLVNSFFFENDIINFLSTCKTVLIIEYIHPIFRINFTSNDNIFEYRKFYYPNIYYSKNEFYKIFRYLNYTQDKYTSHNILPKKYKKLLIDYRNLQKKINLECEEVIVSGYTTIKPVININIENKLKKLKIIECMNCKIIIDTEIDVLEFANIAGCTIIIMDSKYKLKKIIIDKIFNNKIIFEPNSSIRNDIIYSIQNTWYEMTNLYAKNNHFLYFNTDIINPPCEINDKNITYEYYLIFPSIDTPNINDIVPLNICLNLDGYVLKTQLQLINVVKNNIKIVTTRTNCPDILINNCLLKQLDCVRKLRNIYFQNTRIINSNIDVVYIVHSLSITIHDSTIQKLYIEASIDNICVYIIHSNIELLEHNTGNVSIYEKYSKINNYAIMHKDLHCMMDNLKFQIFSNVNANTYLIYGMSIYNIIVNLYLETFIENLKINLDSQINVIGVRPHKIHLLKNRTVESYLCNNKNNNPELLEPIKDSQDYDELKLVSYVYDVYKKK